MTNFYRFPAMAKLDEWDTDAQLEYIRGEIREAENAYDEYEMSNGIPGSVQRVMGTDVGEKRIEYGMELMDIIHSSETALRMMFWDYEVDELQQRVIDKNRKRGYYDD